MENYNNPVKKRDYQNEANKKKQNLEEGDLIWMLSPIHNDYYTELHDNRLGQNKIRPGYINKVVIGTDNKRYLMVTHGTSKEWKALYKFHVEEGGTEYLLNPEETYFYPEEQLNSLQRQYIGRAHPDTIIGHELLQDYIKGKIRKDTKKSLGRTDTAIKTGTREKVMKLIQKRIPEVTREDVWHKKVYQEAGTKFKTVSARKRYLDTHLHNYPWLDDEPSE